LILKRNTIYLSFLILCLSTCKVDEGSEIEPSSESNYQTKNVVIISIDGPRYIDTWNNTSIDLIPNQRSLKSEGVFFNNFYNNGFTYTMSGHAAITSGYYENIHNNGTESPANKSIFQQFLSYTKLPPFKSCIIASKKKLDALGNTKDLRWHNSFLPLTNTENREDSVTLRVSLDVLSEHQPSLTMIHFKGPDVAGHGNRWDDYLKAIQSTDIYVKEIWNYLQTVENYRNKTTLLITNDHGRHLDGIQNGFISHGDRCEGCKHISLLALGPDLLKGSIVTQHFGQIDLAPTIARLLNFPWEGEGKEIIPLTRQK